LCRGFLFVVAIQVVAASARADDPWVVYPGSDGPGTGKHIVLVSGDEEYRSEEALPQLGKILATRHGFTCTVLFAVDPVGHIDPNRQDNIPGTERLADADLMIIATRFRKPVDNQMQPVDDFLRAGKPVLGLRTATHAFQFPADSKWAHYSNGYRGPKEFWQGGFGRCILGEMWISHHGRHKHQSTRGIAAPGAAEHTILRGISEGDVWGPSDVYGVRLPLPGDAQPIVLGQVVQRTGEFDETDLNYGMRPDDDTPAAGDVNDPMMPVVWTKTYQLPDGSLGRACMSTLGASTDLVSAGTRRLLVNAVYWLLEMDNELPPEGADVELVGDYAPTQFEFRDDTYWQERRMTVDEHRL
jgi:hypothetical protein